jgi:hypothetical protein
MLNCVLERIAIDIGKFPIKELQGEGIKAVSFEAIRTVQE